LLEFLFATWPGAEVTNKSGASNSLINTGHNMATQHDIQIKKLHTKITDLKKLLASLGEGKQLDTLLLIIHRPGWTTLREVAISAALVDSLTAHAQVLVKTHAALVQGAKATSAAIPFQPLSKRNPPRPRSVP
jgi:hypothetical protein